MAMTTVRRWARRALEGLERLIENNDPRWKALISGGGISKTGTIVTPLKSLESSAGYAAVTRIAEDLASLPCIVYRRRPNNLGRERDPSHWLYPLLHDAPNPEMDAMQFHETLFLWAQIWGRAYAEKARTRGEITELWPIHPDRVTPMRIRETRELVYKVDLPEGQVDQATGLTFVILARERLFHLRGPSIDAVTGMSPTQLHAEAIGLSLAAQEFGARFFANDAMPGGAVEHPGRVGDVAYERMKASFERRHKGLENAHRWAFLEEGMKLNATQIPNSRAQWIELREFQIEEEARVRHIPPHMIGHLKRATFSNIEHQGMEYVRHTLRPWATRFERAVANQLLEPDERMTYYCEFLLDALQRGDLKTRYEAHAIARQWGWKSANDVLRVENDDPIGSQGDIYMIPSNMMNAESLLVDGAPADPDSTDGRMFRDALLLSLDRVARKEATAVLKSARKLIPSEGLAGFEPWARGFYERLEDEVSKELEPAVRLCATSARAELEDERVSELAKAAAARYARSGLGELAAALRGCPAEQSAVLAALEDLVVRWNGGRSQERAAHEAILLDQALTRREAA